MLFNFLSLDYRILWLGSSVVLVLLGIIVLSINAWLLSTPTYHLLISGSFVIGLAALIYISFILYDLFR